MSALPLLLADAPTQTIGFPVLTILVGALYVVRARQLAHSRRAVPGWRRGCFGSGLIVLLIVASPPVDQISDQLLVAHMAEHLLIGDIAALLLVLGLTGPMIAPLLRNRFVSSLRALTHPVAAILVWGTNFYVWHSPYLYQAALRHDALHALEHATFLAFGIAVWMALLGPLPKPAWFGNAAKLGFVVAVRLIGTVLANIMIFSGTVLYPFYEAGDAHWQIGQLADQVAAGGLMMVEESFLTIGLFCWLFLRVARESEQRQELMDFADQHGLELDARRAARAVAAGRADELWERLRRGASPVPAPASASTSAGGRARATSSPSRGSSRAP